MAKENKELTDLIAEVENKRVSPDEQFALMEKIKRGYVDAIYKLVDSMEGDILSIIEEYLIIDLLSVGEMLTIGRQALARLAIHELGCSGKESFFRFSEWAIRQAIMERLWEVNETWLEKELRKLKKAMGELIGYL